MFYLQATKTNQTGNSVLERIYSSCGSRVELCAQTSKPITFSPQSSRLIAASVPSVIASSLRNPSGLVAFPLLMFITLLSSSISWKCVVLPDYCQLLYQACACVYFLMKYLITFLDSIGLLFTAGVL